MKYDISTSYKSTLIVLTYCHDPSATKSYFECGKRKAVKPCSTFKKQTLGPYVDIYNQTHQAHKQLLTEAEELWKLNI